MAKAKAQQPSKEGREEGVEKPGSAPSNSVPSVPATTSAEEMRSASLPDSRIMALRKEMIYSQSFSGPLPPPEILAQFEQIVPGSAARLITMAEKQAEHRQSLERTVVEGDSRKSWYGLWTGFTLGMTGLVGSVILGYLNQPWPASIMCSASLGALVSVFVIGSRQRQQERAKKADILKPSGQTGSNQIPTSQKTKKKR